MMVDHLNEGQIMLGDADFPQGYENLKHKEDFTPLDKPVRTLTYLHEHLAHNRLIARLSWQDAIGHYFSMSLVCDTGAPKSVIYLGPTAFQKFREQGLIFQRKTYLLFDDGQ